MCPAFAEQLLSTGLCVGDTVGVAGYRAQGRDGLEEASFPAQELESHGAHWVSMCFDPTLRDSHSADDFWGEEDSAWSEGCPAALRRHLIPYSGGHIDLMGSH